MPEYKWRPIEDLPEELYSFSDQDLRTLEEEWRTVREKTSAEVLEKILTEIKREWAIETGKIEGLYTLSKGITETLIQYGISAKLIPQESTNLGPIQLTELLKDQQEVIEGLIDYVAKQKPLTLHYIRQMHQVFTRHQDTTEAVTEDGKQVNIQLIKGDWKKWPNNPLQDDKTIHEYCTPEQVPNEMEHLMELHQKHVAEGVSAEAEAAFLHHRFTQIHPFQDGNGRIARALASLIFLREGDFPFVVQDEERKNYIDALEVADQGDLMDLIDFMVEKQKELLYKALREAQNINLNKQLLDVERDINYLAKELKVQKLQIEKANNNLSLWKEIVQEIVMQFRGTIKNVGLSDNSLIEKIRTESVLVNAGSSISQEIGRITTYDIYIKLPNQKTAQILKLFFNKRDDGDYELYARFWSKEKDKNTLQISANVDRRIADLQFRKWFQKEFNRLIQEWRNI